MVFVGKKTPNWKDVDLSGKCGNCRFYHQRIDKYNRETARGNCSLRKNQYQQRTDRCLKYIGVDEHPNRGEK